MKKLGFSVLLVALFFGGCASYIPPKYSPLTSMTVVMVQRYPAQNAKDAASVMQIIVDGRLESTVDDNRYAVIPVNDGVHNILVKVGDLESERLNFTANQRAVPFLATIESKTTGMLFWKKTRRTVKLERSIIADDTGVMTDKSSVEIFTP